MKECSRKGNRIRKVQRWDRVAWYIQGTTGNSAWLKHRGYSTKWKELGLACNKQGPVDNDLLWP